MPPILCYVSGLGRLIAAELGGWDGPRYLEQEIFGSGDPDRIAICVDRFCSRALGSSIERYEFFATSVMSVDGVRLVDGRRVVVKVGRRSLGLPFLFAVQVVQAQLASHAFACPRPLLGPTAVEAGIAVVEQLLDGGVRACAHDAPIRGAMSAIGRRSRVAGGMICVVVTAMLVGCGDQASRSSGPRFEDPGPVHVHGLGVDPADGALFVATHTGLFRAAEGQRRARRVAGRHQDTMGFTVVGPQRFLGSGHPDLREKLPPFLGLIESTDGGRSWRAVSLQGKVDFHVLEASGRRIYGYGSDWDTREPRFLASDDGGRSWQRLEAPEALIALAISPTHARSLIASGERRVFLSPNGGRAWKHIQAPTAGLLAWSTSGLFLVGADGRVWRSADRGSSWQESAAVGGQPAALDFGRDDELLVALHDGTIKRSTDRAGSWTIRSQP